jgi:hypothetical protein
VLLNNHAFLCLAFCNTLNPPQSHSFLMVTSFHIISYFSFSPHFFSHVNAIANRITDDVHQQKVKSTYSGAIADWSLKLLLLPISEGCFTRARRRKSIVLLVLSNVPRWRWCSILQLVSNDMAHAP